MTSCCRPQDSRGTGFGNIAVLLFVVVQALDGAMTYLGMAIWGASIEANPLISSAVAFAGPGTGLAAAKLLAIGCGIMLHLRGVHHVIVALTGFYLTVAIAPWTAMFLVLGP